MSKHLLRGIGLRREHIDDIKSSLPNQIDFLECAPENWMNIGGKRARDLSFIREHYPLICHGLSLSIGSPAPLNEEFILNVKKFLEKYNIDIYSEHISYCSDSGQLYDLLPIPFTEEAVEYIVTRIHRVQELLERTIAMENVSYYAAPGKEISEIEFINAVLEKSGCDMLLDVNNIYVNSVNHHYDAKQFLKKLKPNKVRYIHIAGHLQKKPDLIIDTHAEDIIDPVYELLEIAYQRFGVIPTLLERDNNIPPLADMINELEKIKTIQQRVLRNESKQAAA